MKKLKIELDSTVVQKIMDKAIEINAACEIRCRDFQIMLSPKHEDTLILRWTTVDILDIDRPIQCYRYECFNLNGTSQGCSIYYTNQEEANEFIWSLEPLYQQQFAIDHQL